MSSQPWLQRRVHVAPRYAPIKDNEEAVQTICETATRLSRQHQHRHAWAQPAVEIHEVLDEIDDDNDAINA